jgi:repressor LexA
MEKTVILKKFAKRLSSVLEEENIDVVKLGKKIGFHKSTIYRYMTGELSPKITTVQILAEVLNLNFLWLMGYDDVPKRLDNKSKGIKIPVLGKVVAGIPIEAVEEIIDYEEISQDMATQGEYFGLVVRGDSMTPRFLEGDVVIVRKQSDVESGDIAVVLVNGSEATIKRISKDVNGITLVPLNNAYLPKFYSNEDIEKLPVTVIGKVVELRGKF